MVKQTEEFSKKFIIWAFSIVLAISIVFNLILVRKSGDIELDMRKLSDKNSKIVDQFRYAKTELNKYKGISVKLDEVVKDATKKLEEKEKNIRVLINDKKLKEAENQKLLKEIEEIQEKYVNTIDSLLIVRQQNSALNNTIDFMFNKIEELNTKLGYASRLSLDNLNVKPLKKSFANKESQTALAKRTIKLNICFDILDNKVTDPGMKDIYIRILTPNAEVLSDSDEPLTFMHPEIKQKVKYTMVEPVNFKNQKMNMCIKWAGTEQYIPGLYIAEIFTKDNKLGVVTFTLK